MVGQGVPLLGCSCVPWSALSWEYGPISLLDFGKRMTLMLSVVLLWTQVHPA